MNQNKLAAMTEKRKAEEIMMVGDDYRKAKEHLRRASQLFPAIEDLEPLKTACDILLAANDEIPGCGVDHYWVLGVEPSCSFFETRSRYQKLVNLLQPIGKAQAFAGRAFKLLENALFVLTDVNRRTEFDHRRKKSLADCEMFSASIAVSMPTLSAKAAWSSKDLTAGQIWAVFGETISHSSMPRHYVRFDEMISESQAAVTYLEPAGVRDHEVKALREKLPVSCGIFRISERACRIDLWRFWFRVRYQPTMSCYKICPREGEVWAMHKDWNARWGASDYERSRCMIVRVESSAEEGSNGITVSRLREVEGCLTLFCKLKQDGFDMVHVVPNANMLCFSHRIPAFRVPGIKRYGIPEDSWHLEPNALPLTIGN
ncbi:unnamed protein product [Linum trigynum]|uniref:J domain-containing protein n=1 Tax=Linum trigynum TaxID=586398 RepID=A0AAV2G7C3_9ROSI